MSGKGKVLLMDDEQVILDVTGEILTFLKYDVMSAKDGQAAVDLYKKEKDAGSPFDVVILDLSVPMGWGEKRRFHCSGVLILMLRLWYQVAIPMIPLSMIFRVTVFVKSLPNPIT